MWIWAAIIVSCICTFISFYMALLAIRLDSGGVFLFSGSGIIFGVILAIMASQAARRRNRFLKRMNSRLSGKPAPVTFVPHRFMMASLIITVLGVLAAIFIPIFFR